MLWALGGAIGLILLGWGAGHLGASRSEDGERAVMALFAGLIVVGIAVGHLAFGR